MAKRIVKSPVALVQAIVISVLILTIVSARERRIYDNDDGMTDDEDSLLSCPFECDCKGLTVDCSNRGLTYVPKNIPSSAKKLDLRQNEIRDVEDGSFQGFSHLDELILFQNRLKEIRPGMFKGLRNLKTLLLNANNISRIHRDTFSGMTSLRLLSLYDNNIETISEGTFKSLEAIQVLHLGKNPFRCDCDLRWMADFLNSHPVETSGAKCQTPKRYSKRKITSMDYESMGCQDQADGSQPQQALPLLATRDGSSSKEDMESDMNCPENCSCIGSSIQCPSASSSSDSSQDSKEYFLDESSSISSGLQDEVNLLAKHLNKVSRNLVRLSRQLKKVSQKLPTSRKL